MKSYKNFALGDLLYSDKKHEEEMAKLDALNAIANKSSSTSVLVYAIPIVGLIVTMVIIAVAMKRKKS